MALNNTMQPAQYDANNITVLEGLEAVRRRPGMYIGGTDSRALHHMVYEVVDNSIDEAMAGAADAIEIVINPDESVSVSDNGRGIPVGRHEQTGMSALTVVMTKLHAGGKFGGGGYKVSGGLHGVGVSAVNALSDRLEVQVRREGKIWRQRFERGIPQTQVEPIGVMKPGERTGTTTIFLRDPEIFEVLEYRYDTLLQRFREMAFLTRGITLTFKDLREKEPRETTFYFEGGVQSFVRYLNKNREVVHEPIYIEREIEGTLIEAALAVHRRLQRIGLQLCQHHQHPRRRQPFDRPARCVDTHRQRLCAQAGHAQGKRHGLHRRRHARRIDGDRQRQVARSAVREPDQGQAAQCRGQDLRAAGGGRCVDRLDGAEPARRQEDRREVPDQQPGARRHAQGARPGDPQERAGKRDVAGQAGGLL